MNTASPGERDLQKLLEAMRPELEPEIFVFCTLPDGEPVPAHLQPLHIFREREGLSLIVKQSAAEKTGLAAQFPSRQITLTVHSSLHAVGFLAVIAAALAAEGISVNVLSAFHHDHLFVPADRAEDAMRILERLATHAHTPLPDQ